MPNVTATQAGHILTITVDLSKEQGPSASGKTTIVASTGAAQPCPNNPEIKFGVNVHKPR